VILFQVLFPMFVLPQNLVSINPSNSNAGQTLNVTIIGNATHFSQGSGTTIDFGFNQGSSTVVNSINILSNTSILANITIPSSTNTGDYDVYAYNFIDGNLSLNNGFHVNLFTSAPIADFSGIPTNVTVGDTIAFTDLSTNTPTSWLWNFGDGGTSTVQNPTHIYITAGTYTVSLTASNYYGSNTATKNNYITVSGSPWQTGWFSLNSGTTKRLYSVYFTNANTGYAVGDGGTILNTSNIGSNWALQTSGVAYSLGSIYFPSPNIGYTVGSNGTILKSNNAGTNWTAQSNGESSSFGSVYFTDINTGYVVGAGGKIMKTSNSGANWTDLPCDTSILIFYLYSVAFTDINTGYAVGSYGTILKTTNAGASWTAQSSGTTNDLSSVYFTDANTGYAVGKAGTILKTSNAGNSWVSLSSGTTKYLYSVFFTDSNIGYVVGDAGTIIKTTNAGNTWTAEISGVTNVLYSVFFTDANTGYAVGDNGTILKTLNGGIADISELFNNENDISVYPNPAINNIIVESSQQAEIKISNIKGQLIKTIAANAGKACINVSEFSSGVYIVEVKTQKGIFRKKFVKN